MICTPDTSLMYCSSHTLAPSSLVGSCTYVPLMGVCAKRARAHAALVRERGPPVQRST